MPPNLTGVLNGLGYPASSDLFDRSHASLGGSFEVLTQALRTPSARIDVADLAPNEVRQWLSMLSDAASSVLVVWPANRVAAEMPFATVIDKYDDLWYPSTDDVLVMWPDGQLLLMDHEERFCLSNEGPTGWTAAPSATA